MIGRTVAHYTIVEKIGAGGMGEVYRARDTKLGRDVAIKILPSDVSNDPERVARFRREARTLASLHHPHIASIFGFEETADERLLVMELVEGDDLFRRLQRGPIPVNEALDIARQMAEGLEAAHEKGIVHRDLKPANVKVTRDGKAKILDFGLARAYQAEADDPGDLDENSPTITAAMTQAGTILGTAAYMSPEQVRGQSVDKRADIWAFGVILLEMLTGRMFFSGGTVSDTLVAVLKTEIDWSALPAGTPPRIRRLLRRCLDRNPKQRLRDIGEARIAIGEAIDDPVGEDDPGNARPPRPEGRKRTIALWLSSLMIVGLAGVWAGQSILRIGSFPAMTREFEIPVEGIEPSSHTARLSPDGRRIVLQKSALWIRRLDEVEAREIPDTEGASVVAWSPDGRSLAFFTDDRIWRYDIESGGRTRVCDAPLTLGIGSGIHWGPDDRLVFASGNSDLHEVSARGGDPKIALARAEHSTEHFHIASFLPGGELVYAVHGDKDLDSFEVLTKGERKVIFRVPGGRIDHPIWSPSGHLLYTREIDNKGIWALPFSPDRLEVMGEPFLVVPGGSEPSVSSDGSLLYYVGEKGDPNQVVWVDETGTIQEALGEQDEVFSPSLSPDGRRVAVSAVEGNSRDIWVWDLERGSRSRLTFGDDVDGNPIWMPGGDRILYVHHGEPSTIRSVPADGSAEPTDLFPGTELSVSADGTWIAFVRWSDETLRDVWGADVREASEPFPVVQTSADELNPAISPDGSLLAYRSIESGRDQVHLRRFPGGEGRWQVSTTGGTHPFWSPTGDRIFYGTDGHLAAVAVASLTPLSLSLGRPEPLFEYAHGLWRVREYDPVGKRFLGTALAGDVDRVAHPLRFVENWYAKFRTERSPR